MARTPYILDTGESYRDILTVESSKLAAEMAKRLEYKAGQGIWRNKDNPRLLEWARVTPEYSTRQSQKEGILKKDEEIFDFTDSRLINPPTENRQNVPSIEPEVFEPVPHNFQKSHNFKPSFAYDPEIQVSHPHTSNQFQRPVSSLTHHNFPEPPYDTSAKPYINLGYEYLEKRRPFKTFYGDSPSFRNNNEELNHFNSQEENNETIIVKSLPQRATRYHDQY